MKYFSFLLINMLPILVGAQITMNIQQDTAKANDIYLNALVLLEANNQAQALDEMEKAIQLYEPHVFDEKLIDMKGQLLILKAKKGEKESVKLMAEPLLEKAMKDLGLAPNTSALASVYHALQLASYLSNQKTALDYGWKGMNCLEKDESLYFSLLALNIETLVTIGALPDADSLIQDFEHLLNGQPKGALKRSWLDLYRSKMQYFYFSRNPEKALLFGKQLFVENDKFNIIPPAELASDCVIVGRIQSALGRYEEAINWIEKGRTTSKIPVESADYGTYYHDFGDVYYDKRDTENAIINYDKAIQHYLRDSAATSQSLNVVYYNLGNIYDLKNEYEKAIEYIQKSQNIGNAPVHDFGIGRILSKQGKYEQSAKRMHSALLQVCTLFDNPDFFQNPSNYESYSLPFYANYFLHGKSSAFLEWGKEQKDASLIEKGIETAQLLLNLIDKSGRTLKGFEQSKQIFNQQYVDALNLMMDGYYQQYYLLGAPAYFDKFFQVTEKRKAIQLIETLTKSTLPEDLYQKEQALVKAIQLSGQKLDLAAINEEGDSVKFYQEQLFAKNQELEDFLDEIKQKFPRQTSHFFNADFADISTIQSALSDQSLLLSYNLNNNEHYIVSISKNHQKIYPADFSNLKTNIERLKELTNDNFSFQKTIREEFIQISHQLYQTLIKPVENDLNGKSTLMIVLEGQLFHLPFELLLKNNEKKSYSDLDFLLKSYEINYHYSTTTFLKLKEKVTPGDYSFLGFAPVFESGERFSDNTRSLDFMVDSLYRSFNNAGFATLLNTQKEIETIAAILKPKGSINTLIHKEASKVNLSKNLEKQSYQFIHIATHGLVNYKNPKLSALACYAEKEEENLLYANEIQFTDINADLVVLSSCESGIGHLVNGEGLIALNRSFIYAGAKNVLFSLWKVSDKYSSQLMIDFYKNYLKGQTYTTALRNAKLKMLENSASALPKHWGAFVLMGE